MKPHDKNRVRPQAAHLTPTRFKGLEDGLLIKIASK
nr:MAG TPA: hypothetical protein [Caudoviricetes sp.]